MKTQVIQLEKYDDVISTRDKLGWSKARRLCWFSHSRKDAAKTGSHSADPVRQVAGDADCTGDHGSCGSRSRATEVGLPFFTSIRQAQRKAGDDQKFAWLPGS